MSNKQEFSIGLQGVPDYEISAFRPKKFAYALVIPVINENGRLLEQLKKISILNPQVDVIIADGGSTDGSTDATLLKQLTVSSLLTKKGSGKLSAQLRMAFHYCLELNYEGVITMDGNNKDGEMGINTVLNALKDGFDFVQGTRFRKGGISINTPLSRFIAIRMIHAPLISLGAKKWFTDTTNGFRGHSKKLVESQDVGIFRDVFNTYELLAYLPIAAQRCGFKTTEVGVLRQYPKNSEMPTKINGFKAKVNLMIILIRSLFGYYNK